MVTKHKPPSSRKKVYICTESMEPKYRLMIDLKQRIPINIVKYPELYPR